jgi:hypothetical protein
MTDTEARITDAPAPWRLGGRGYISLLKAPKTLLDDTRFLPPSLHGKRSAKPYALMMFVDYDESPVGPYHELLFIPGSFGFEDGKRHLSISRIFVSSMDSVVNGQRNWGIPKDVAQFDVQYGDAGLDRVRVSKDGHTFAELDYRPGWLGMPFSTGLMPKSLRTLAQHHDEKTFIYAPEARGSIKLARLRSATVDAAVFPDIGQCRSLLTVKVTGFDMGFPVSRVLPHAS